MFYNVILPASLRQLIRMSYEFVAVHFNSMLFKKNLDRTKEQPCNI